jgi:hypothetical protein
MHIEQVIKARQDYLDCERKILRVIVFQILSDAYERALIDPAVVNKVAFNVEQNAKELIDVLSSLEYSK